MTTVYYRIASKKGWSFVTSSLALAKEKSAEMGLPYKIIYKKEKVL